MTKYQDENQLKGRLGELLAAFIFPDEWVVRPIAHDFGLDLQVEVFTPVPAKGSKKKYQTWGEHIYLQVKTTDKTTYSKAPDGEDEIDVLNFSIATSELRLVEAMGASVPVVLLVVNRTEMTVFYLCLNDYISKVLATRNPDWRDKKRNSITLKIPTRNQIRVAEEKFDASAHWGYFTRLAKRSKLYSAANLVHHYSIELENSLNGLDHTFPHFSDSATKYTHTLRTFTDEIAHLDIWRPSNDEREGLSVHRETLSELKEIADELHQLIAEIPNPKSTAEEFDKAALHFTHKAQWANNRLKTLSLLGRDYEDIVRWERLPAKSYLQG